ncbi:hypothetical protein [Streptomyces sp. AK02-01A]|uniref:hypothetical protein n=1 Tax=Streptomyces sp. AK02-01A TaxID=3028648 RepID=UPI0029BA2FC0|nr:hypothetical protein [Streptomyces sp. AK02-01A]MDX3853784.1 hypothetical protein [Streptomyces sp. AK02-01A]
MLRTVAGTLAAVAALGIGMAAPAVAAPLPKAAPVPVTGLTCDGDTYKCTAALKFGDGNWKATWAVAVAHQATSTASTNTTTNNTATNNIAGRTPTNTASMTPAMTATTGPAAANTATLGFRALAPVPATAVTCDGNTYKCTAALKFGDGNWKATWAVAVTHQATSSTGTTNTTTTHKTPTTTTNTTSTTPTTTPANTVTPGLRAAAPVPATAVTCDGDTGKCTAALKFGDGNWKATWNATIAHQK